MSGSWYDARTCVRAERCSALDVLGVPHGFALRQPGIDVAVEREEAVARLAPAHLELRRELSFEGLRLCMAQQVHGAGVAEATFERGLFYPDVDALVTNDARLCLGIYVADCCAVFIVDSENGAVALAHAGAKGTRLGVVPATIELMRRSFASRPEALTIVLSACIRPPLYEVDFAAEIREQCKSSGVSRVLDSAQCTGSNLKRYYSYRMEQGRTGRMLALLAAPR